MLGDYSLDELIRGQLLQSKSKLHPQVHMKWD